MWEDTSMLEDTQHVGRHAACGKTRGVLENTKVLFCLKRFLTVKTGRVSLIQISLFTCGVSRTSYRGMALNGLPSLSTAFVPSIITF